MKMQDNILKLTMGKIRLPERTSGYIIGRMKETGGNIMNINISTGKKHTISPYIYMQFAEPLGTADTSVDAGWDYLHDCWQPKLVDKVRELEPTMIRWGGCFASYYHWKEAVGPRDARVPMLNLCWDGMYSNQVGTHELVDLCRTANAEPLIVVNMESDGRQPWAYPKPGMDRLGTSDEAAEWVRYCNDPDDALRISHGVKEPYNVKFWQIGNETSYDRNGFDCETTALKTVEFAGKMKAADPSIKLIAWGDTDKDGREWAPAICEAVGDQVEYIAFHHHFNSGLPDSPLYGTEYRESLYESLFTGYAADEMSVVMPARFSEDEKFLYMSSHVSPLVEGVRVYDYASMEIVEYSHASRLRVSVKSYTEKHPDWKTVYLSFVYENGDWYLDSPSC